MKKPFRDLTDEAKTAHQIGKDASDETWLYCADCSRAVAQGDCVLDDDEGVLRCPYDDCGLGSNLAFQSLYGWGAYRQAHTRETLHWPEEPVPGERYELRVANP